MPPAPRSGPDRTARAGQVLAAALPYLVFLALAILSWGRWIEPYVDAGRELEIPRRVANGERLYRDVRFYYGPLAPYLAAAVDRAAGPSLPARIALAAVVALANLEALRRLARRMLPPARAGLLTSLVVAIAFFQRPGGCYLFPYSLDTAMAVGGVAWALSEASGRQSRKGDRVAAAGLLVALLARPETGLLAIAALALERRRPRRLATLALAPIAAAGLVYAVLSAGTPLATLRREGWLAILGPPQTFRNVYATYAGLDRPGLRLAEVALAVLVLLLVASLLGAAAALAARTRRFGAAFEVAAIASLAVVATVALAPPDRFAAAVSLFPPLVRVVPPLVVATGVWRLGTRLLGRIPAGLLAGVPDAILFVSALFAGRLLLAAGYVGPYAAFFLPLPLVVAGAGLDRLADRASPSLGPRLPRLATAAMAIWLAFRGADLARIFRHPGWARVATPAGDLWLTEPVASTTREALRDLAARVPKGGSLVGFPEGGFFHYVLGLANPLPEDQFYPGHLDRDAEASAIARLAARPPDAIVYANVVTVGFGALRFGRDYLSELDQAARELSVPAASYGPGAGPDPRVGDPDFFVQIRVPRGGRSAK